ncbi:stalk domain-containing protein [Syntrophothermus lipocalidus]|uniref:WD40 domain protein beta Propeller n=1 Tax=Syntrophothermus lipocalidus (strain DSM 12680 / TGB-C1) TaxID=643648 RepID=D7CMY7_SYNLT|nr:stalk domain-containing protein [Syntrophothermus lipocalidus]ADI02072.1 WD40 domain protein beta Propeller [Syntrophothermus lipocalidus DSM 12680]
MEHNSRGNMWRWRKTAGLLAAIFGLLLWVTGCPAAYALSDEAGIKVYCNADYRGSTAYIDTGSGVALVPLALIEGIPGLRFDIKDNQAWFAINGRQLKTTVGSNTYTLNGKSYRWRCGLQYWEYGIAVPARDLFEALGCGVRWDGENRAVYIDVPVESAPMPQRVAKAALPLRMAFIHDERLWLLDMNRAEAEPQLVPGENVDQIIGWSEDGQWLAYLRRTSDDEFSDDTRLWVVRADGEQSLCLDDQPVVRGTLAWSPAENAIAYQTMMLGKNASDQSLKLAVLENGKWVSNKLVDCRGTIAGLSWFPGGCSIAVTWRRGDDGKEGPVIDRIDLGGKCTRLFTLPSNGAESDESGLYPCEIRGLKLSPDGRYAAYFLALNSESLNADGMTLQVVDLQNPQKLFTIGDALGYPEWLTWSPDSRKLACIVGCDRIASTNKRLKVVDIVNSRFQEQDLGEADMVDSRPFWGINGQYLFYARGRESGTWLAEGRHQEVRVPGQQVWCRKWTEEYPVTVPENTQADYPLSLSPDGKFLVFERLDWFDQGSLYLLDLGTNQEVKVLDNLQVDPGFYGNYYPDSVSIKWVLR